MRNSTRPVAFETSPACEPLSSQLQQRVADVLAVVAAFDAEPVTPESTFALEKKWRRFFAMPAAL